MLSLDSGFNRPQLDWVTAKDVLPYSIAGTLILNPTDIVGRIGLTEGEPTITCHLKSPRFVVLAVDESLAFSTDFLAQAKSIMRDGNVLVHHARNQGFWSGCWLVRAAKAGFASGSSHHLSSGGGILNLACRRTHNLDQLLRKRQLSASCDNNTAISEVAVSIQ
ncbi:hypothetical protein [Thalassobius sp. I31.1]|uniref:hypothetical protein n=1 Tax=Thalassobius sp. I31.1 TaxID=2109912 RepID=UPI00130062A8|nr:hypothetical protein [Thalassobius sp. I31.1]